MKPTRILITGCSAGIGKALAEYYAGPEIHLGIVARRLDQLEALAETLRDKGASVQVFQAEVRDQDKMATVVRNFAKNAGGVDLVIANAGISRSDRLLKGSPEPAVEVFTTNVIGVLNTLVPAIPIMAESGGGHLVTIGSVAGFRGLPGKGSYCASKAAVKTLMDSWRPVLKHQNIRVSTIAPGWVKSELTDRNDYSMPFIMPVDKAAGIIARAISRNHRTYVFPWQMRLVVPLMKIIPECLLPSYSATR